MSVRQTLLSLIVCKDNVFSPNYIINMWVFTFSTKNTNWFKPWWYAWLVACSVRLLSLACVAYYLLQPENGLFYRSGVRGKWRRKRADGFLRGFKRGVFHASQTYRETLHGNSYAFTEYNLCFYMVKAHAKLPKNSEKLLKNMEKVRKNLNFGQNRLGMGWFEAAKWLGKRGENL